MPQNWIITAAINGFIAVAAGAFAAHALNKKMSPDGLRIFETAVRYQMYHALALLAVAWVASRGAGAPPGIAMAAGVAGWAFSIGILLFSGSLYALCLTGISKLGMITPFGGVGFLVGWVALAIAAVRMKT